MPTEPDAEPDEYEALADADVTVRVTEHGLHVAEDAATGVSSQGKTEAAALANLAAAVDAYVEARSDDDADDWL